MHHVGPPLQDRGSSPLKKTSNAPLLARLMSFPAQKSEEHRFNYRKRNSNNEETQQMQNDDDTDTDVPYERPDQCRRMDISFLEIDDDGVEGKSSCIDDHCHSIYDVCQTIDDSMCGLHTYLEIEGDNRAKVKIQRDASFEHDWVLDGTDSEEEDELHNSKTRRMRKFGDAALDQMLGMLEIENASLTTSGSSCGSFLDIAENKADDSEEMIEFADFSQFDPENGVGSASFDEIATENNLQNDVLYEYGVNESNEEKSLRIEANNGDEPETSVDVIWSSPEYRPPSSIECLVSDLDAELDVTIKKCLALPLDTTVTDSEGSSSHDQECANLLDALNEEQDLASELGPRTPKKEYRQPLLMSPLLLESLPIPVPTMSSDDPAESFTRRIQNYHLASISHGNKGVKSIDETRLEDELLEKTLADTIHPGYFCPAIGDCDSDYFDSIVLEEVLTVPWPFHVVDLKEPFIEGGCDSDSDESEKNDHLDFDTYISNRLSELEFASGEIMRCLLSRVGQKEGAINEGVEQIFASEFDITTALVFAKSSREFMHRAKHGYPLDESDDARSDQHNVVSGSLEYLHFAESRDRLRYLLETIDTINHISDVEVQWWKDAKTISSHRFHKLVDDTTRLKELVRGEEVLNRLTSLCMMSDRINELPGALLQRVEVSLADLFSRILHSGEISTSSFDAYFLEYETLLNSWLSCCHLRADSDQSETQKSQSSFVAAEWSACILKIFCFEAIKASAFALIDSYYDERVRTPVNGNRSALDEIKSQVSQKKDQAGLESLSHTLLVMRLGGGHHSCVLSSTFFHLCSRLVELMTLYSLALQWHKAIIDRNNASNEPISNMSDVVGRSKYECYESNYTMVSSISSDRKSFSSADEGSIDEEPDGETSLTHVPENLEFKRNVTSNLDASLHKSMELIRRALWKKCEAVLVNIIEFYISQGGDLGVHSGDSTDFATANLRVTYDILQQFSYFSSHFLDEDEDGEQDCSALENELSKLMRRHLRSVHTEAMTTTGTLLSYESWQLAPLELAGTALKPETNGMGGSCDVSGQTCENCNTTAIRAIYESVGALLLGSVPNGSKSEDQHLITTRANNSGYLYCSSFARFLENEPPSHSTVSNNDTSQQLQGCFGLISREFSSMVSSFVERRPCGEPALLILTQSSAGLAKWTARLLAIGNALPLVAKDASSAVMTLIDLYILTVFRFCARSKLNEDVLIGFGRGTTSRTASSTTVSLSMEADVVSPLPREKGDFVETQDFVRNSRKRLESMVDLDKFESSNDGMCPTSPRSKNEVLACAKRLEKETAAAYSCLFVAMLVDVASKIFNSGPDHLTQQQPLWDDLKDMTTSVEKNKGIRGRESEESLEKYAKATVSVLPNLVTQATRITSVNSISGRELIFQIMCCGRVWEGHNMQEQSNSYVDDLCEKLALIWGYLSDSMRLSPPALQYVWDQLVRSAFFLLLEGFSKVRNCSTEGRSLMSMDLATLFHGLIPKTVQAEVVDDYPTISAPPHACREEMMRYVDTFVKVFYFPYQDIIDWIEDNSGDYHLDHSLSLITSKSAGSKDKRFTVDGKKSVANIYDQI